MIRTQREALGNQSLLCKLQIQAEVKTRQCRAHMNGRGTNAVSGVRPVLGVSSMPFGSSTCLWHCWMHRAIFSLQQQGGCREKLVSVVGSAIPGSCFPSNGRGANRSNLQVNQVAKQDAPETHSPRAGPTEQPCSMGSAAAGLMQCCMWHAQPLCQHLAHGKAEWLDACGGSCRQGCTTQSLLQFLWHWCNFQDYGTGQTIPPVSCKLSGELGQLDLPCFVANPSESRQADN